MKRHTFLNLEYHPCDSRIRMVDDEVCQTLNTRMGTGGGNVPLIIEIYDTDEDESALAMVRQT